MVILIDALAGDDRITIGPTVQKTVWVDARAGRRLRRDPVRQRDPGRPRRVRHAQRPARRRVTSWAGRRGCVANGAGPADGRLTRRATFDLAVGNAAPVEVVLTAGETLDNTNLADLVVDLNHALAAADLAEERASGAGG